jgi:hypothetical protein
VPIANVTGAPIEILNLALRFQPAGAQAGEHYLLRLSVNNTAEVLTAQIMHSGGAVIAGPVTIPGLTDGVTDKNLAAAFQVEGQTLRAAVWAPGGNAPVVWNVVGHSELINLPGLPGVRTGAATGNTNVPFTASYDNIEFRRVAFCGELAKLLPIWDEGHRVKHADVRAAGVTQRLGRPQRPNLDSAFRRYAASNSEFTTTDAWPLDEPATEAKPGRNLIASGSPAGLRYFPSPSPPGAVKWGQDPGGLTSVRASPDVSNNGQVFMPVNTTLIPNMWLCSLAFRSTSEAVTNISLYSGNSNLSIYLVVNGDGSYTVTLGNFIGAPVIFTGSIVDGRPLDRSWHTVAFGQFPPVGGQTTVHMSLDGEPVRAYTATTETYAPIFEVNYTMSPPVSGGQGVASISSVVVAQARLDSNSPQNAAKLSSVTLGWPGETSVSRAFRLTAEEGVQFDYLGPLSNGGPMGPQKPLPLLDLLQECADVDGPGGLLYEPRYTAGVALRPRIMACSQGAAATLNYAAGQVAPPLAPSADDRPTTNIARAERVDGGFVVLEQKTGPLNTSQPGGADPNGIGDSPGSWRTNARADVQLPDVAGRMLAAGTVPDPRYPKLTVELISVNADQQAAVMDLTVGDRLVTTGLTAADIYQDLDQLVRGGREISKNVRRHWVEINTAPYDPYRVGVYDDTSSRYGLVSSLAGATVSVSPGTLSVATAGTVLWTTAGGDFPFFIVVGRNGIGQVMQVSAISGASSPQTFTISSPNVNGVARTWPVNTEVRLYQEVRYG